MNPGIDALLSRAGELIRERADLTARMRIIDMDVATLKRAVEFLSPGTAPLSPPDASRKNGSEHAGLTQAMLEVLRDAPATLLHGPARWCRDVVRSRRLPPHLGHRSCRSS